MLDIFDPSDNVTRHYAHDVVAEDSWSPAKWWRLWNCPATTKLQVPALGDPLPALSWDISCY